MRRATIWAALLGMAIAMPATAAEEPSLVGAFGEVSRLEFQGVASFAERSIRQELEDDFQVIVASDPGASLDAYLSLLELKIRDGYRDGGFFRHESPTPTVQGRRPGWSNGFPSCWFR